MNGPKPKVDAHQAAALFAEMAELMEIRGGDPYRARSFQRAARILGRLDEPLVDSLRFGALARRRGIGAGTLDRLSEMLRSGSCRDLVALRGEMPSGVRALLEIDGIGPKTVRLLWTHLRIGSIEELERAARGGRLAALPRWGERAAERIVAAIEGHRKKTQRTPLHEALQLAEGLADALRELPNVQRVTVAGSARRRKETVGDLDLLAASYEPLAVSSHFITLPQVDEVLSRGESKTSVRLDSGQQVDLRVLAGETFGAGLCYFTGSQQHNIMLRARGNRRKLKISEHGVFTRQGEVRLAGALEEEIFAAVGLPWIPPELRENAGELEAAESGGLPRLVERGDLRGDLHLHTDPADRTGSAEAIARAAAAAGLSYLAFTDPSRSRVAAGGLDSAGLREQQRRIAELEQRLGELRLLCGVEVEILPDGSLDADPALLAELDWVVGAVHVALDQPADQMTRRVLRALESGQLDVLAHPLARQLRERPRGVAIDLELLFHRARRHDVALEINGAPLRLDLPAELCRKARKARVALAVGSDARCPEQLAQLELAVATARRGWVEPRQLLNCLEVDTLLERRRERLRRQAQVAVVANETPGPETSGPGDGATIATLVAELATTPLPASTRRRLDAWLRGEADEALSAALELSISATGNPTQHAFTLLWRDQVNQAGEQRDPEN
jgi:DNA polymerase (family 10)